MLRMKNSIIFVGFALVFLNTIAGLIVSGYQPFNMIMADISLLISVGMMYGSTRSSMPDGYKIGLSFLFIITGLLRFICAILSAQEIKNNVAILFFAVLIAIEAVCVFIGIQMKNK